MRTALVMTFLFLGARPASAGALGDVVGGLQRASDDDDKGNDHKGGGSSDSDSSSNGSSSGGWESTSDPSGPPVMIDWTWMTPPPPAASGVNVFLYLGGQSVVDSNASLTMEMRGWYEDFGLGVRQTSFFEEAAPRWLRLDLWAVSGHYRVLQDDRSELWIEGGLGDFRTLDDLTMVGAQGGLRMERHLVEGLGFAAEGRTYLLENSVRALELRAAFRFSVLYLSYRMVDFNVGPPLHGPELGIGLTF